MATFSPRLHAFYLRFNGNIASFRNSQDSYSSGFVNIPMGLRFIFNRTAVELGGVSSLGWVSMIQGWQRYSSGPLFFGAQARLQTAAGYLEVQRMFAVSPADADHTTVLTCGHFQFFVVCAEGSWLRLRDLSRGDEAHYARVGLRIGFGSWGQKTENTERKWIVPDIEAHTPTDL